MTKIACVAVVKNEERTIAEWIAYQFVIGFDTVILLDNHSTDGTAAQAARFSGSRDIRILEAPDRSPAYQKSAYLKAINLFGYEFDWMAFFDADEFLTVAPGGGLKECLTKQAGTAAIGINWAMFGSSSHRDSPAGLTIVNYQKRAPAAFFPNKHVKSIVRPDRVRGFVNGHCFAVDGPYRDLAGRDLVWDSPGITEASPDYRGGKLHHYFLRSRADWLAKVQRGYPDLERRVEEFDEYDRNEVADDAAARLAPDVQSLLLGLDGNAPFPARPARALGIAITTFNRREMLLGLIDALRRLTFCDFELVVCDDASTDGTVDALRALDVRVITGTNRGIAWNKNRGLFYLREIAGCEVILMLDDDVMPVRPGWEQDWIHAARRLGHVNFAPAGARIIGGANTHANPGISDELWGQCIAFSRHALSYVGYMDTRFKSYGHEHTDLTKRAIRAGFGGFMLIEKDRRRRCFYSIEGGLTIRPAASYVDHESIARNGAILELSESEPVYRNAWRDGQEYAALRSEMPAPDRWEAAPPYQPEFTPDIYLAKHPQVADRAWNNWQYYRAEPTGNREPEASAPAAITRPAGRLNLARGKAARQSSISEWSRGRTNEQDAAGAADGRPSGQRRFHTDLETNPWWQVDLGDAATIAEIRIYNTTEEHVRGRFTRFKISIAFDPEGWVDVFHKEDDTLIGGIDGNPFIWRPEITAWGRFVRVTLLGKDFLHLDQVMVFGPGAAEPEDLDARIFENFVSLGDNCEFGLVQRAAGYEALDLLRFGGTGEDEAGLILALNEEFAAFGTAGDLAVFDGGGEWIARSRRYGVTFHTNRKPAESTIDLVLADELKKQRYLARKMVEDLQSAPKIFVRKSNKLVSDDMMLAVYQAMRRYGAPTLLWITAAPPGQIHGTVKELQPGLLRGYIKSLAPYECAHQHDMEAWRDLCRAALPYRSVKPH